MGLDVATGLGTGMGMGLGIMGTVGMGQARGYTSGPKPIVQNCKHILNKQCVAPGNGCEEQYNKPLAVAFPAQPKRPLKFIGPFIGFTGSCIGYTGSCIGFIGSCVDFMGSCIGFIGSSTGCAGSCSSFIASLSNLPLYVGRPRRTTAARLTKLGS